MEAIGVEAIVQGLLAFESDMNRMQKSIEDVTPSTSLLGDAFSWLSGVISNFGDSVKRIVETALGVLLRDAIRGLIDMFQELGGQIIDAGNEFQVLTIRLNGMNLDEAMKSGRDLGDVMARMGGEINDIDFSKIIDGTKTFAESMADASVQTRDQLTWIQALSAATPFNSTDIANTYALARSYGFADVEARRLTKDITDFSASMGLSSDSIVNIVQNLGTMDARGKITFTAIRNLTRSAFLPLDDVLGRVAEKLGTTTEELTAMISKPGEGVPAQLFIDAFQEMVEQEPRFIGAAGRLGKSFQAASENAVDLWRNIGGASIVMPILDVLGGKISDLVGQFVTFNEAGDLIKTDKWLAMVDAADRIGSSLSDIATELLGLLPSTEQVADGIVNALEGIATWLENNKDGIVTWVQNALTQFDIMKERLGGAFDTISESVDRVKESLMSVSGSNGKSKWDELTTAATNFRDAVADVIAKLFGVPEGGTFFDGLIVVLYHLADWVIENKDKIIGFILGFAAALQWLADHKDQIVLFLTILFQYLAYLEIFKFITGLVFAFIGAIFAILAPIIAVIGIIVLIIGAIFAFAGAIAEGIAIVTSFILVVAGIVVIIGIITFIFNFIASFITTRFNQWLADVKKIVGEISDAFTKKDWEGVGKAILSGISTAIEHGTKDLMAAISSAVKKAYTAAMNAIIAKSPSKLFMNVGKAMMTGMAGGILDNVAMVARTMTSAVGTVTMPAMMAPAMASAYASSPVSSIVNNRTQNYNLNITSNARTEPIIQDFNMLRSLHA